MVSDFGTLNTSDLCFLLLRCIFTILIVGLVFLHCLTKNATSNSDMVDQKFEWTINNLEKWVFNTNEGDYYGGLNSLHNHHKDRGLCAVCCNSTTVRCSRCKAVRYCSPKCQLLHWRAGHKEQCLNTQPAEILNLTEAANRDEEHVSEKSSEGEQPSDIDIHGWSSGGYGSCSISGNSNRMSSRNGQLVHYKSDHNAMDSQTIGRPGLISEQELLAGNSLIVHEEKQASYGGPVLSNGNTSKSYEFETTARGKQVSSVISDDGVFQGYPACTFCGKIHSKISKGCSFLRCLQKSQHEGFKLVPGKTCYQRMRSHQTEADDFKIQLCDKHGNSEEGIQSATKGAIIATGNEPSNHRLQGKEPCIDLSTEAAFDAQPRNIEQTTQEPNEVLALLIKLENQVQEIRQLQENMQADFLAKADHHKDLKEEFQFLISRETQKAELCLRESMKAEFVAQLGFLKQMKKKLEVMISSQVEAGTNQLKENLQSDFVAQLTCQKHMQEKLQESLNGQVQGALQRAWSKSARPSLVCGVCWTNDQELAFGCGHMSCNDCGSRLSSCHLCRRKITTRLKLFPG